MKRIMSLLIVLCFVLSCFGTALAFDRVKAKKVEKTTVEMKLKKALVASQVLYFTEHMRAIALEYTGLCFKDKRYINARQQLEQLTKEKGK